MTALFERVMDFASGHADDCDTVAAGLLGSALRAVLGPHKTVGSLPAWCCACNSKSPCPPLLLAADELGLTAEEAT